MAPDGGWKSGLERAGILLLCYFMVPFIIQWTLGARDVIYGSLAVSNLAQAGMAAYILYKLSGQKELLMEELKTWLDTKGQPRERTLELAGKVRTSGWYICAAALLLPPLGETFPGSLLTFIKFCAAGYTAWMAYSVWKLAEPYLACMPPAEQEEIHGEPPAPAVGRCVKCGQQLTADMNTCAFCGHPVK